MKCRGRSSSGQCISETAFCDGVDDCGNNWDEEPVVCGQFCSF